MKRWGVSFLIMWLLLGRVVYAEEMSLDISAPSAILMEATSGQVLYEKEADVKRAPASVTKIMTLLLIFEALEEGKITLDDEVPTSEFAASMGGSQVYLEPGEVQNVDTLIKCIAVASANDACVVMSEYICGSETEFVSQMNKRAMELGMVNTHFVNCNGLEAEGHETTARDIALMSKELITKYPQIRDYCMIWQENIIHTTRKGSSEFGLTNTNKLVRHYEYATGLKTGFTSQAGFCISATAEKEGVEMIAVIMAAADSTSRNKDAITLLNYGFGKCQKYESKIEEIKAVPILRGKEAMLEVEMKGPFTYIDMSGADLSKVEKKISIEEIAAPVSKGDKVGEVIYSINGTQIGTVDIIAKMDMEQITYRNVLEDMLEKYFAL